MCVRYFSEKEKTIIDDYLGLVKVVSTTGEDLFQAIKAKLNSHGLTFSQCIGYSSDGASNVIGCQNSVWSRIKAESPNCVLLRCTCHSLNLIVQHAFEVLPSSIGYLLSEVPAFFSRSTIRREEFKKLFDVMDPNQERAGTPTPFQKFSVTRWLVRGKCLYNLLVNWHELKAFFSCAEQQAPASAKFKINTLKQLFKNDLIYLYIVFLTPIVQEFERINSLFQSSNVDPEKLMQNLELHYKSLKSRVYDSRGHLLPVSHMDLGAKFSNECTLFIDKQPPNLKADATEKLKEVKINLTNFLTPQWQALMPL